MRPIRFLNNNGYVYLFQHGQVVQAVTKPDCPYRFMFQFVKVCKGRYCLALVALTEEVVESSLC